MSLTRIPVPFRVASRYVALWLALLTVLALVVPTGASAANRSTMDVVATYEARAKLTWSAGPLDVWSRAHIRNTSGHGIERIDFNLVPAQIGNLREPERDGRRRARRRQEDGRDHQGAPGPHASPTATR